MDLQKRTAIAVVLSIIIIIFYSVIVTKLYHTENKEVMQEFSTKTESQGLIEPTTTNALPVKTHPPKPYIQYPPVILERDNATFEFSSLGGNLVTVKFKDYDYQVSSKVMLATEEWSNLEFTHQQGTDEIVFKYEDNTRKITKRYKFSSQDSYLELFISYIDVTSSATNTYYTLMSEFLPLTSSFDERFKEASMMLTDGNMLRTNMLRIKKGSSKKFDQPSKWVGFRDKYFAYIISPLGSTIESTELAKSLEGNDIIKLIRPLQNAQHSFIYYYGPQTDDKLAQAGEGFEEIRNFGKLDILVKFLLSALVFIQSIVRSWGISIIILTIAIYFCLYPLTLKQMHSMKKMQTLQPEMETLRAQYKDAPQKLNKEIMELYRKHNANPLGGCLPIIFQIPVFFSLFQALSRGIQLKGAGFLWIKDLSEPDRLMPKSVVGIDINLLPILMMVAMFFQQKMSMRNMPSSSSEQQRMMLWIMPVVFGFIFYNMPSGLVLYWFTNSLLMMVSQWKALK